MPIDTLDFRHNPVHIRGQGINRNNSGMVQALIADEGRHPVNQRPGTPHSSELDLVDMHVERLALEVASDEHVRSSVEITLPQTGEPGHVIAKRS